MAYKKPYLSQIYFRPKRGHLMPPPSIILQLSVSCIMCHVSFAICNVLCNVYCVLRTVFCVLFIVYFVLCIV